jgi:hypothetical protein
MGPTPENAKKILEMDFAQIEKKAKAGKKLTRGERALLQSISQGGEDADSRHEASSWLELAEILGVTTETIRQWRKIPDCPQESSNRTHDVIAWRQFVKAKGLRGNAGEMEFNETQLRGRKLLAEVEERELKVAIRRGFYVTMEAVRERWTYHVAQAHAVFRNKLENELPPLLVGLDAVEIRKEMVKVVDEITSTLRRGDYPKQKDPNDSDTENNPPRKGRAGRKVSASVA